MSVRLKVLAVAVAALALGGCIDQVFGFFYDRTATGELKGTLQIRWVSQDSFVFVPDPADPLTFKRADGTVIQPGEMYTDGGTIPTALRAIKAYSPWGYAPAFIIHDWLFVMQHCKLKGHDAYDLEKAATIMAEAVKTMMEKPEFGGPQKLVHYSMYEAVRSSTAKSYWENGKCDPPGAAMARAPQKSGTRSLRELAPSPAGTPMPTITIRLK